MERNIYRARLRLRLVAALAAVLVVGAACAGEPGAAGSAGATGPSGASAGADAVGGYGGAAGGAKGGGGDGGNEGSATVQANNFSFDPSELRVPSGTEIEVKNGNSKTPHTFTVLGTDIDVELEPLGSMIVAVDLDPGTYDFRCRFHPQMTGTLTVT